MARFIIGIDLGTSNCAVAFTEPAARAEAKVVDFAVPQLLRPGELTSRPLYPSVVYLPLDGEFPAGSLALPWASPENATGELARWQGGRAPGRVVTSAKSWLIHEGVDRQADILPWGAAPDVRRLSPVAVQAELLRHLASAWNHAHPDAPFVEQEVVLTIPASFDEAARALTLQAAKSAGFELARVTLLEEPQAAFYDFTSRHRADLPRALAGVRLVLVVDVGGGTTDFSLVQIALLPEGPALQRIAVGDHLLLGGDNMDAALAQALEAKAFSDGRRFTPAQWTQALHQARQAKETLLGAAPPPKVPVVLAQAGSRLVGGTLSLSLEREELERLIVQGFFPAVTQTEQAQAKKRAGVVELGLPYATDPAITRHVVSFLTAHAEAGHRALGVPVGEHRGLPRPDAILLNGGVFNSPQLSQALVRSLSALWPDRPPVPVLPHDSLDLAVARGAAYSGLARRALGQKIGGGAPRAFYALVAGAQGKQAVCLVPRGLEEGQTVALPRSFALSLGRPVQFQLSSTTADRLDKAGDLIDVGGDEFRALPPLHTILEGQKGATAQVTLEAHLTEVGTLALSAVAGDKRWRLEFELKGQATAGELTVTQSMPARFGEATLEIERVFGTKPLPVEPKDVKNLFRTLERILGPRESWTLPVLRELWTALFAGAGKRRRSADHERIFFQLLGYTLRPGFGYPLDEWRCEQVAALFKDSVTFHQEAAIWAEFWVLWRRVAPGLTEAAQRQLFTFLEPHLARRVPVGPDVPKEKLKGVQPQGVDEMVRCAAALERLPVDAKLQQAAWIWSRLEAPDTAGGPWTWALGRLGARVPMRGAAHRVVPAESAEQWVDRLLALDPARHDGAGFALTLLSRNTGDRSRDVSADCRARVLERLRTMGSPPSWQELVANVTALSAQDEARALGDTLPIGLALA